MKTTMKILAIITLIAVSLPLTLAARQYCIYTDTGQICLSTTGITGINGSSIGTGTVTNIATGQGLTGGPITTTGTISLSLATLTNISQGVDAYNTLDFKAGTGTCPGGYVENTTVGGVQCGVFNLTGGGNGTPGTPGVSIYSALVLANGSLNITLTNGTTFISGNLTGPAGATGATGAAGANGSTGPQGIPGTNGTNGAPGIPGTNGTNGVNGSTGPQGPQGEPGVNGTNGAQGETGPPGTNGTDGNNFTYTDWFDQGLNTTESVSFNNIYMIANGSEGPAYFEFFDFYISASDGITATKNIVSYVEGDEFNEYNSCSMDADGFLCELGNAYVDEFGQMATDNVSSYLDISDTSFTYLGGNVCTDTNGLCGGGNPFNQSLNTTDDVIFDSVTANSFAAEDYNAVSDTRTRASITELLGFSDTRTYNDSGDSQEYRTVLDAEYLSFSQPAGEYFRLNRTDFTYLGGAVCTDTNGLCPDTSNTTAQMQAAVNNSLVNVSSSDLLDGQHGSYYAVAAALTVTNSTVNALVSSNTSTNARVTEANTTALAYKSSAAGWTNNSQNTTTSLNVGIGTTGPLEKLSVSGNLSTTTGAFLATSSGNVGIGTPQPNYTLDVIGTARVSGGLFANGSTVCTAANGLCALPDALSEVNATAVAALPKAGGTMTGNITLSANTQLNIPASGMTYLWYRNSSVWGCINSTGATIINSGNASVSCA